MLCSDVVRAEPEILDEGSCEVRGLLAVLDMSRKVEDGNVSDQEETGRELILSCKLVGLGMLRLENRRRSVGALSCLYRTVTRSAGAGFALGKKLTDGERASTPRFGCDIRLNVLTRGFEIRARSFSPFRRSALVFCISFLNNWKSSTVSTL